MSALAQRAPALTRDDSELVAAVRTGDDEAFAEIHGRYAPRLEAYCARLLGGREDAEDAVQQVFLKAHQSLARNGNEIVLEPWLYTIARNESYTMLRSRQRRPATPLELVAELPTPSADEQAVAREAVRETLSDISALPEEQREALVQTSLRSEPSHRVAESLGCEPAKVKSLVFRARAHLSDIRTAREMSCNEVSERIRTGSGGALRQRVIREHLRRCENCAELAERPRHRRRMALPIVLWPFIAGKPFGGFGIGAGVESAAAAGAGGGAASVLISGLGTKVATVAVAAIAAAGGVAANHDSASRANLPSATATRGLDGPQTVQPASGPAAGLALAASPAAASATGSLAEASAGRGNGAPTATPFSSAPSNGADVPSGLGKTTSPVLPTPSAHPQPSVPVTVPAAASPPAPAASPPVDPPGRSVEAPNPSSEAPGRSAQTPGHSKTVEPPPPVTSADPSPAPTNKSRATRDSSWTPPGKAKKAPVVEEQPTEPPPESSVEPSATETTTTRTNGSGKVKEKSSSPVDPE